MIDVQTFNASGDVIFAETFRSEGGALKMARMAFKFGNGVSINGCDCFTFAEAERALHNTVEVAA